MIKRKAKLKQIKLKKSFRILVEKKKKKMDIKFLLNKTEKTENTEKINLVDSKEPINEGIKNIEAKCFKMELPLVIKEEAKSIYKRYENEKKRNSKRFKKNDDLFLSIIFLASNRTGGGRTIKVKNKKKIICPN